MIGFEVKKESLRSLMATERLAIFLGIMISVSMFNAIFTNPGSDSGSGVMVFAQNTNTTQSNVTQTGEATANQTGTTASKASSGALAAINQTGQFVGNVSETIAENPVVTNMTGETQEFFADKSK